MTGATIAGGAAAFLYLASAAFWWRAASLPVPLPVSGFNGLVNAPEVIAASQKAVKANRTAALLSGFASMASAVAVFLAT